MLEEWVQPLKEEQVLMAKEDAAAVCIGKDRDQAKAGQKPRQQQGGIWRRDGWGGVGKAEEEGAAETMLGDIWSLVSEARAIFWPNTSFWQCTLISRGLYRRLTGLQGRVQGKARHDGEVPLCRR